MGDVRKILVVTGTRREASALGGVVGLNVLAGGSDPAGLETRLLAAAQAGAAGIVRCGMGGALDPALRLGDWVIGQQVTGAVEARCDVPWAMALRSALPQARLGAVYADGRLIAGVADKQALHNTSGAIVADMESHIAARVAAQTGLPLAVLRCVSDEALSALPPAISVAMRSDGRIAPGAMLGSILGQPGQIAALVSTGLRFNRAYRVMARGAQAALLALR